MILTNKTVLITGANGGIGRELVTEALSRGAARVYAATRKPLTGTDIRVTNLIMDVTEPAEIEAAADAIGALDVLVNNAGIAVYDDLSDPAVLQQHLAVNLFGTHAVTQAFGPKLVASRGAVVNVVSIGALAPVPVLPSYSISKAAVLSLSQSQRMLLAGRGVSVHAVLAGAVDTEMIRDLDIPKADPADVARAIFDGVEQGEDEIFPDGAVAPLAGGWRNGVAKAVERQNAALVPERSEAESA